MPQFEAWTREAGLLKRRERAATMSAMAASIAAAISRKAAAAFEKQIQELDRGGD